MTDEFDDEDVETNLAVEDLSRVDKFLGNDGLSGTWAEVRDAVLTKLVAERRGSVDTLTMLSLERLSYLYARIRQKEAMGAFGNDRNYKSAMMLLSHFMAEVRKADNRAEMVELMKADVVSIVVKGVKDAVHELPAAQQKTIMSNVLTLVSSQAG